MLETPKRKRVTRNIMIISYIFNISIISTLITIFTSTQKSNIRDLFIGLIVSIGIIILLFFSRRISSIRELVDSIMLNIAKFIYNIWK